ncbi:MAG: ribosomal RNA small subunit methyltransferase A [Candidatus Wildermuthbacteria bacterium RIFCSPLOWO2_01_FULL_47_18]|uniref:Ribosomal RNA small subunit methyltransferase A n=2 Tax=Candidatus Wildermuthiibacteriota TaxID=1817923 RepID=A0A1G2RHU5_9BACT|nr:MAG: ribosomal RNA small subunit methyltransferase A [Candidatus Wildermuthbacteria bacterium RIFCSPHIGHO2_02_FULL_48_16]OHA71939.1 MAG: ribosomal RNA small subunit methyltransferase A [Candidatus Wildermuthbacteria bacterium RIFCSPLOWO2_01_FULL_47_18]
MDTAQIKKLLQDQEIQPRKGLGQNFLVAKPILDKIIAAASLAKKDTVLEIGPGLGVLTKALAQKVKRVVAVEKDPAMVDILLRTVAKEHPNVEIIEGDVLKIENWELKIGKNYRVVANLPYYITSPVIRLFLEAKIQPKVMVLMVQKEVAQRICAKPPEMSLLAVSVQAYAKPEIISIVSKNAFWPQPKVDSAVIKITPTALTPPTEFFAVVKAGFKHPRKQLAGNLAKGLGGLGRLGMEKMLLQLGISSRARAETLSVEDWRKLAKLLSKK